MYNRSGKPPKDYADAELTPEEIHFLRARREAAGHWAWLWRSLKQAGIIAGAIVATASASLLLIAKLLDLAKDWGK